MNPTSSDIVSTQPPLPPLVLVGSDALAARLVGELAKLGSVATAAAPPRRRGKPAQPPGFPVTVLVGSDEGPFVELLRASGARVLTGSARDMKALETAGVGEAAALVLLDDDDVQNLHAALAAREINPEIRLVLRMFDERLAGRVRDLFGPGCTVLSASAIAAPSFVDAALGDGQQLIEVAGRTLNAGPPATVTGSPLAVLARTDPDAMDGTELLPDAGPDVELVLGEPVVRTVLRRPGRMRLPSGFARWASARLRWTLVGFSALVAAGTVVFHANLGLRWLDAFYAMVSALTTGAPDDLRQRGAVALFTAGAMLAGVVLIALITAFAVDDLLSNRLSAALGPPVGRVSGHVVVCGLGTVGLRMIEQLRAAGVPVVGIEREPDALVVATARRLRVPIVRGDASDETTLRHARAERALSVVAMTDEDEANIEVGLAVWALDQHVRIVLRLFDRDLSDRITGALPQAVSLSVSAAAAPVFLAAILGREVRAAIGHGRRVLLVAELPVDEGSPAEGAPLADFDRPGEVRILGHVRKGMPKPIWAPYGSTVVQAGDALLLVATRAGFTDALLRTGASSRPARPPGSSPGATAGRGGGRRRSIAGAPANRRLPPARAALRGRWRPVALPTRWLDWDRNRVILGREGPEIPDAGKKGELPDARSRGSR